MKRAVALTLLALVAVSHLAAATVPPAQRRDRLAEAIAHHAAGELREARADLEFLLEQTPGDPVLLYNLGVVAEAQGRTGEAIWCHESALLRDPDLEEARRNLGLIRPVPPHPPQLVELPFLWARDRVTPRAWSWLLLAGWVAFAASLGLRLMGAPERFAAPLRLLTRAGAVTMVVCCGALALQWHRERHPPHIVVEGPAQVRSAPGADRGDRMAELPEGVRLWALGEPAETGWVKIETEAGDRGFADASALRPVRFATPTPTDPESPPDR